MRGLFLSILAALLGIAIVRFTYGLEANSSVYIFSTLLELPPDIKEEFQIVIEALEGFYNSLRNIKSLVASGEDLFTIIKSFFSSLASLINIPLKLTEFLNNMIFNLIRALGTLFKLYFGPVVVPID